MSARFVFSQDFVVGPPEAHRSPPLHKTRLERRHQGLYGVLRRVERVIDTGSHLRRAHVEEAAHVRVDYPPSEFGAFLVGFSETFAFSTVQGLNDPDAEGYFGRYHSERFDLHCAVLFTEQPSPRLGFLSVGGYVECRALLKDLKSAECAAKAISAMRAG